MGEKELKKALEDAKGVIAAQKEKLSEQEGIMAEQDAMLRRIASVPPSYAPVCALFSGKEGKGKLAIVFSEQKYYEVEIPEKHANDVGISSILKLTHETGQFLEVVPKFDVPAGKVHTVRRLVDERYVEIDDQDGTRIITYTGKKPEIGDRVVPDIFGNIIIRNLGKEEKDNTLESKVNVKWDDIGGLVEAKEELIEAVILPQRHPEIFKHYGKKPVKGVLLYGDPGNGKTLLAKAMATAIAETFGATSTAFYYVKGPEILNKYVGESEAMIRRIFHKCKEHKRKHKYPAVLFLDEADAILGKRGTGKSSDMERTIVPQFLSEMDGIEESGAFVIMATNRQDVLDPAVVRDGRIDRKIMVPRPDRATSKEIFKIHLRQKPIDGDREEFTEESTGMLFSEDNLLYEIHRKDGEKVPFTIGDTVNGAMIEGLVERATSLALRRDMAQDQKSGIRKEDMSQAVQNLLHQQRGMDHKDEVDQFISTWKQDVKKILRVRS